MLFKKGTKLYSFEVVREAGQNVMYINYLGAPYIPDIAENSEVMGRTVDTLIQSPNVSRFIFVQQRNFSYDSNQVEMLVEIAQLYIHFLKQEGILSPEKLTMFQSGALAERYEKMSYFMNLIREDPIAAYIEIKRFLIEERVNLDKVADNVKVDVMGFIRLLEKIRFSLESTRLIKHVMPLLANYSFGDRSIYSQIFRANIIPNFTFTRLVSKLPEKSEIIKQYKISSDYDESTVTILKKKDEVKYIYHVIPPEFAVSEEKAMILNLARNVMIEHRPKSEEFTDPERTRNIFFNVAKGLVSDLARSKNVKIKYEELNMLANILVRSTIGFGLLEVLLQDKNLQDIFVNAPISMNPIFVRHNNYDECVTNIIPSMEDADSWAAKFRMLSGRPLDEANPILDTSMEIGNVSSRVAVIQEPLSPNGLSYAIRRHREAPWTLPLFIKNKMINPMTAGLMSFLIDGARTFIIAGTRSSGKTSLLGALMLEIMPKFRVLVIEDTLELPVDSLRKIGYDILRMKVRSALLKTTTEVSADEGIRTSLRLGDSCLIIGEVRSVEAKALYESMRVGALANVVAGTIHGADPYGVFDRVVNDLEVPPTSFKATDIIMVANPIKSPDGMHSWRRVLQMAEVRKHWEKDPLIEKGFVDLMKYNVEKDELEPSDELINGESEIIKSIASNVKGWAGNWDAVWDNILLRGDIKKHMVDMEDKLKNPMILEHKFNSLANAMFYETSNDVMKEIGMPTRDEVLKRWKEWF
ncbi:MAG: type II/IV secretion system ATPase subunit, partial [Nanoarchaeota archaeon]|nr:type II/IV secretion system ATPase subunit [Nanoarchaeota archaeon]